MLMKHPNDNKIYKSDDEINWKIATIDDVYDKLTKTKEEVMDVILENEKLKELLKECKQEQGKIRELVSSIRLKAMFDLTYKMENKIDELDK